MATDVTKITDAQATTLAGSDKVVATTINYSKLDGCTFYTFKNPTDGKWYCTVNWGTGSKDVLVTDTGMLLSAVGGFFSKLWILATGS